MKIESTKHYTEEECKDINEHSERIGLSIRIESKNTCNNPGMGGVAKLFLNSLWGKFGTREIMGEYSYVRTQKELWDITSDSKKKLINFHHINDNLVEVLYERNCEDTDCPDYVSPITAVFTTSNARVRLIKFMNALHPSQLLYCDTDSCYFAFNPNNPNHIHPKNTELPRGVELGNGLGCWEEELKDGIEFAGCGAKTYGCKTLDPNSQILKAKGITIDYKNRETMTFETMAKIAKSINNIPIENHQQLLNKKQLGNLNIPFIQTEDRFRFDYNKKTKDITTNNEVNKILQNTVGLKRFVKHNTSYPYGYAGEYY